MQSFDASESGSELLSATIDRRSLMRKIAGAGVVAAAAGVGISLTGGSASAQESYHYRTTSSLNLRTGPGTRRRVILVLPDGALVTSLDKVKNGFRYVSYQGTKGWAFADYLEASNGGSSDDPPVAYGNLQTTDSVNFRWQPSLSSSVIQVLPAGAVVEAFDLYSNGFQMVGYAQIAGWVHMDYLGNVEGPLAGYVVTTTALNLRAEASLSSRVLTVMPKGAKAFRGDVIANDFLGVTYNGMSGWAHVDFLKSV
ncbi:MAG: SH3 domain-containing protein [Thermomicrobiales bacterium]|nr:SH3 domain-containing protein [Thermomicrobiales bacterium]